MISVELAEELQRAGLVWRPVPGDQFAIPQPDLAGEVYTVSNMTIEAHAFPGGTVLGFNGTTEWALDSVSIEETVWLPREDQLRQLLGGTFISLQAQDGGFLVTAAMPELGRPRRVTEYAHADAACAYGQAVLELVKAALT